MYLSFIVALDVTLDQNGWLKFNPNQTGYYRVNYPAENWKRLSKALQNDHEVAQWFQCIRVKK
jgi:glutamyl aminopeptidase